MMDEVNGTKYESVSVIVPVFDERDSIRELHERITKQMAMLGMPYEIIFVDDGSKDGTDTVIEELCEADDATGYIRHFRNNGKSMALMQGFGYARGDIAITLDGDLQDEPENIGLLIEEMRRGGFDLVNGCRRNRQDDVLKKSVSKLYNLLVRFAFRLPVRDVNSGMKAYSANLYKNLDIRGDLHRLIPAIAYIQGYRISEVGVSSSPRRHGRSKYRLIRYRGLIDLFSLMAIHATHLRPFRVLGGLGAFIGLAGLGSTVATLVTFRLKLHNGAGLALFLISQTLFLIGCLSVLIGVLAETLIAPMRNEGWRSGRISEIREPKGKGRLSGRDSGLRSGDGKLHGKITRLKRR